MKSILFTLAVLTAPVASFAACPGAHLKLLMVGEQEVAGIHMQNDIVVITDEDYVISRLSLQTSDSGDVICGLANSCGQVVDLNTKLLRNPDAYLSMTLINLKNKNEVTFAVTDFRIEPGAVCAKEVRPESL